MVSRDVNMALHHSRVDFVCYGSTRDSLTAYAARQVYIRNRTNLRPVAGICLQMKYGSTLYFSQNTRKA